MLHVCDIIEKSINFKYLWK